MSRDWTPMEAVVADECIYMERGEYLHDATFVMSMKGKEDVPCYDLEARKEFPNLCYLLDGFEMRVFKELKDSPAKTSVYRSLEENIGRMADSVREQVRDGRKSLNLDDIENIPETARKWFEGILDEGFYYNEYNNELLYEWIGERVAEMETKKLEDMIDVSKIMAVPDPETLSLVSNEASVVKEALGHDFSYENIKKYFPDAGNLTPESPWSEYGADIKVPQLSIPDDPDVRLWIGLYFEYDSGFEGSPITLQFALESVDESGRSPWNLNTCVITDIPKEIQDRYASLMMDKGSEKEAEKAELETEEEKDEI